MQKNQVLRLALLTLLFAACIPGRSSPMPVCTPPACEPGEEYYCPGDCPGGCGTICVTPTPMPLCTPPACQPGEQYYCPDECPGGCGTICVTPVSTTASPPAGSTLYDACAFRVSYPPELVLDGAGWFVFFNAKGDESVQASVNARRESGARAETAAKNLARELAGGDGDWEFETVTVIDFIGEPLTAVVGNLVAGDEQIRLMVVVRPETLLGNMLPDDVVYEIVARAPESEWPQWDLGFQLIFQTFVPWDCGGV